MPRIPFSPVPQGLGNASGPVSVPGGPVQNIDELSVGAFRVAAAVQAKMQANATNKGLDKARQDLMSVLPALNDFKRKHLADSDFGQRYLETLRNALAPKRSAHVDKNDFESEAERVVYERELDTWQLSELNSALPQADAAWAQRETARTDRLLEQEVDVAGLSPLTRQTQVEGAAAPTVEELPIDASVEKVVDIVNKSEHLNPDARRARFDAAVRQIQLRRLMQASPEEEKYVYDHLTTKRSIELPEVTQRPDGTLDLLYNVEGEGKRSIVYKTHGLKPEEVNHVLQFIRSRTTEYDAWLKARRALVETQNRDGRLTQDVEFLGIAQRIHDARSPAEAEALYQTGIGILKKSTEPGFAGKPLEGPRLEHYTKLFQDAMDHRFKANPAAAGRVYSQLLERITNPTTRGSVTDEDIWGPNPLSFEWRHQLANLKARESTSDYSRIETMVGKEKHDAQEMLRSWFGATSLLAMTKNTEYLAGALTKFNERYHAQVRAAVTANDLSLIQPFKIAREVWAENEEAYRQAVFPDLKVAGSHVASAVARVAARHGANETINAAEVIMELPGPATADSFEVYTLSQVAHSLERAKFTYEEFRKATEGFGFLIDKSMFPSKDKPAEDREGQGWFNFFKNFGAK